MQRISSVYLATILALVTLMAAPGCGRSNARSKQAPEKAEAARGATPHHRPAKDGKDGRQANGGDAPEEAVPVEVATVSRGPIEAVIRLSSNLEAERDVTVYAQAPRLVERLGAERVVAVGNGANDAGMLQAAALGIAVLGPEGLAGEAWQAADVVAGIHQALDLLLHPRRLVATLRR